jgi:hypothetical protein
MHRPPASPANLRRILQNQLAIARRLEALAEKTTEALVANDVERLREIGEAQRSNLEQQAELEETRATVAKDLAAAIGRPEGERLVDLLPHLPEREAESLDWLRRQIIESGTRIGAMNEKNRRLLDVALDVSRNSIDIITSAALQPARYGTNLAAMATPTFYVDSKA